MMRFASALTLIALVATGQAYAKDTAIGAGAQTCGSWTQQHNDKGDVFGDMVEWVEGYVSATNAMVTDLDLLSGPSDVEGMTAWLDAYCTAHPLDSIARASGFLVIQMGNRAQAAAQSQKPNP